MRLVIEDAAGTRSVVPLASDEITLGRAREGNTFRLEERNVSRRHARLIRASGAVYIEDLGSLTGTRVNGERITGRRRLREGDLVEIGGYDLALLPEEDRPGAPPALRPTPAPGAAPGAHATPAPTVPPAAAPATEVVAPAPSPAVTAATPAHDPVAATNPAAPPQTATSAPRCAPQPAPTAAAFAAPNPAAPPAAVPATAVDAPAAVPATPAVVARATAPAAPMAAPHVPAPAIASAPPPSAAVTAPPGSTTFVRALVAGAMALALGFGAGWAVGAITAREPPPAGEPASAAR